MGLVFSERFEASGFDNPGWELSFGGDPDFLSSDPPLNSPPGWGKQCLRLINDAASFENVTPIVVGDHWSRVEIYVAAFSFSQVGQTVSCWHQSTDDTYNFLLIISNESAGPRWGLRVKNTAGGVDTYISDVAVVEGARTVHEVAALDSDKLTWRIEGIAEITEVDYKHRDLDELDLWFTGTGASGYYGYLVIDDADWPTDPALAAYALPIAATGEAQDLFVQELTVELGYAEDLGAAEDLTVVPGPAVVSLDEAENLGVAYDIDAIQPGPFIVRTDLPTDNGEALDVTFPLVFYPMDLVSSGQAMDVRVGKPVVLVEVDDWTVLVEDPISRVVEVDAS